MPLQTLIFAGQHMANDRQLSEYYVPPVSCAAMSLVDSTALRPGSCCCVALHRHDKLFQPLVLLHLMQGCQTMIAIETAKLVLGKPDPDSAYWN